MNSNLINLVGDLLIERGKAIKAGNCELTEDDAIDLAEQLSHIVMSADSARSYLNVSRSTFQNLQAENKIPQGKHRRGFKELFYYKDWFIPIIQKYKNKHHN